MEYPKFRWFILISLVIISSAGMMTMIAPSPFVQQISESIGTSYGETTAMTMMVVMSSTAVFALLTGFVVNRLGFALTWIIGSAIQVIASLLLYPLSTSAEGLIFGRALQGMGMGPINAVLLPILAQWFKPGERTYVAAAAGVSAWFGASLGLVYSPAMYGLFGESWRMALTMSAVPPAIALIFAFIIFFGPKPPVTLAPETPEAKKIQTNDFRLSLKTSAIWIVFTMAFFEAWYQWAFNNMAPGFYAVDPPVGLGLGPVVAGLKLTWAGYASMLGTVAAPFVFEQMFKGKPKAPLTICCMISAVLILGLLPVTKESGIILILLPCGMLFFSSVVNPTIYGYMSKHYPESAVGRIGGIATFLAAGGSCIGLAVGSAALHLTGSYTVPNIILAIVVLIAGSSAIFLKDPGIKPTEV